MTHVHNCDVCKVQVAVCEGDLESCALDYDRDQDGEVIDTGGKFYCSVHHPHPDHKVEDKPTVRMIVKVEP